MNRFAMVLFALLAAAVGIYIGTLTRRRSITVLREAFKCPFCYGTSLCPEIDAGKITFRYESFDDFFYNVFSVKNVYFARWRGRKIVLKKLAHQEELDEFVRTENVDEEEILRAIDEINRNDVSDFRTCSRDVSEKFLESLTSTFSLEEIWTLLQVSVEPLMLTLLRDLPVPAFHGACGFLVAVEDCGVPLDRFRTSNWSIRASIAAELLKAALSFTHDVDLFRIYLTDVSPDNIVVNDALDVYFVDLENVIVQQRLADDETVHYSEHVADEDLAYDEGRVCEARVSDHNVYMVCRLLLSKGAPWPMMSGGLLHSPPEEVANQLELLELVEECVYSERKVGRFYIAERLIGLLKLVGVGKSRAENAAV